MVEKGSFNKRRDPSSNIFTDIDVMAEASNAASARAAIGYTEGDTSGAVNYDGKTVPSEKIYQDFLKKLAATKTLALPVP